MALLGLPVSSAHAAPGGGGGGGGGSKPPAEAFQLSAAVVTANPVPPGSACPPAAKTAPAGSTATIVICGRNRTSSALTPVAELSTLTGSFIGLAGTFTSDSIPAGNSEVVLAQWTDTEIVATPGSGLKVTAALGVAAALGSGPRTFKGFTATAQSAPTADPASATGLEDGGPVTVALTGRDPDGDDLTFDVGTAANGLVTVPTAVGCAGTAPSVCTTTVSYTPNANFNGSDSFTYTVDDGIATSAAATSSVTIGAVNDAPSFTKGADVGAVTGGNKVTIANWASGISPGPANESSQAVEFSVVAEDPEWFFEVPAISPSGDLTFTPGFTTGITSVSVVLEDDGGTANGGADSSASQTFTITLTTANSSPVAAATSSNGVEDGATVAVTLTGRDDDGDGLTFDVGTATNGLVSVPGAVDCVGSSPSVCTTTVTYTPNADFFGDDSFTYTVNDGFTASSPATATVTISGVNDAPSFEKGEDLIGSEDSPEQVHEGWASSVTAGPASESSQDLSFTVTTDNDALFSALAIADDGDLSYIPAPDANGIATVSVRLADDGGTANGGVNESAVQTFTITVIPVNDAPSFTKGADQVRNEDAGAQLVTNWATAISKGPADESGQSLSFTTWNDNETLFSLQPGVSPTGTLMFTPAPNAVGLAVVSVSLSDDGGTEFRGDDTSDVQSFTISVGEVNDAPSFTHAGNQTVLEDASAQTVNGFVTGTNPGAGESGQTVTVSVTGVNNISLFSVPPAVDASGTLTYTPAADANGTASVTVQAVDDGGTANGGDDTGPEVTFTITVTAVNDVPSFTKGADQVRNEDAGAQLVTNWATAISKGPADESAQSLTFTVTNDNNALFSAQPAVSPTGTLSFTSAVNRSGTATVSVRLADNGGTANGGDDTSDVQTFTITVNPVNDAPVAAAKSFTVQANMKISLGGLLTGASDPNDVAGDPSWTPSFTLGSISLGAGCVGCTISNVNNAAGTFDFDPPAGGTGTYTFSYTVVDNGFPGPGATSASQTITVTVSGPVVWFVDADAPINGTGRLSSPFNNLASATTAMGTSTDQRIFVEDGDVAGNVTLQTNGWLVSDAATGTNFDALMGMTPPAGTISRPAINAAQRTLTGTVTLGNMTVARGFDLTPTATNRGLVGIGATGVSVNQMSITTTGARAVDLANSSGTFELTRVSATGSDRGISIENTNTSTGSFEITGTGTAGSGGVISDSTGTVAGIFLNGTRNVTLRWMTVSSNDAHGLFGADVTNLVLEDSTFPGNGTAHPHSGIRFINLLGTSSINRVEADGLGYAAGQISNALGSATITVANSTFRATAHGFQIDSNESASVTFTSTSNTFLNAAGNGLAVTSSGSQPMNATITGGTYTSNDVGLFLWNVGPSLLSFSSSGGSLVGCPTCLSAVQVQQQSTGTISGTIDGMTASNVNSAVFANGVGPGTMRLALTNNNFSQVRVGGIDVSLSNTTTSGAGSADLTITGNVVSQSAASSQNSIAVTAGGVGGDGVNVCAHIANNTITNPVAPDILVWNRFAPTTVRLPGYVGPPTDTNAVRNFLLGQNAAADATASNGSGASGFGGGAACQAP